VLEYLVGDIFTDIGLMMNKQDKDVIEGITDATEESYKARVRERMMTAGLIKRGNHKKFEELIAKIGEQYSFNIDVYLKILILAYELIENHSGRKIGREDNGKRETGRGRGGRGRGYGRRERRDTVNWTQNA